MSFMCVCVFAYIFFSQLLMRWLLPTTTGTSFELFQQLLIMQFSHWLQRKPRKQGEEREPWRTLNDGIESIWIKLLITVVFFGSMGIKWAMTV
jgi:hypothetical protein